MKWLYDYSVKYKFKNLMSETDTMSLDAILAVIDGMPDHIIRCEQCKYYSTDNGGGCNKENGGLMFAQPDDFCSYAERADRYGEKKETL